MKSIKSLGRGLVTALCALAASVSDVLYRASAGYMQRTGLLLSAAHTAAASFTGTTYAISATLPATYDAAGYGATTITYTTIGKVDTFPEYGAQRNLNEFVPVNGDVEYVPGAVRYGQGDMTMADIPADAGQVILKAASTSANHYSMKLTYPDGEVHYLDVMMAGWKLSQQAEGGVMKRTGTIGVCKAPVIVAAA